METLPPPSPPPKAKGSGGVRGGRRSILRTEERLDWRSLVTPEVARAVLEQFASQRREAAAASSSSVERGFRGGEGESFRVESDDAPLLPNALDRLFLFGSKKPGSHGSGTGTGTNTAANANGVGRGGAEVEGGGGGHQRSCAGFIAPPYVAAAAASSSEKGSGGGICDIGASGEEEDSTVSIPNLGRIWMPQIYLPLLCPNDRGAAFPPQQQRRVDRLLDRLEIRAAAFEHDDLCFVLFFCAKVPASNNDGAGVTGRRRSANSGANAMRKSFASGSRLIVLARSLVEFCKENSSACVGGGETTTAVTAAGRGSFHAANDDASDPSYYTGGGGLDIIYVDRDDDTFVLLSKHDLTAVRYREQQEKKGGGLFGIGGGSRSKPAAAQGNFRRGVYQEAGPLSLSSLLDCRHELASTLPLDVMLAFDDMFNEINHLSRRRRNCSALYLNSNSNRSLGIAATEPTSIDDYSGQLSLPEDKVIEMCTFLPQGWMYSRAHGDQELYIRLDTSKYVTIADVQKAVARVRHNIANDKLL